jgi:hypothetical protein
MKPMAAALQRDTYLAAGVIPPCCQRAWFGATENGTGSRTDKSSNSTFAGADNGKLPFVFDVINSDPGLKCGC